MLTVKAFAKINLFLEILHKRPDGYHELRSIMQSVSLSDIIKIRILKKPGIIIKTNKKITSRPEDNLVYKAALLLLSKYNKNSIGLEISIQKNIPLAAGLAGGSADCAAVLQGINKLLKLKLTSQELEIFANQLGSDISFCLYGGTMLAEGRGERVTKLTDLGKWYGLILKPPFDISTAKVYQTIDKIEQKNSLSPVIYAYQTEKINLNNLANSLKNDLFPIALKLKPILKKYLEKIKKTTPLAIQMSGSGPAIFAFYSNKTARNKALKMLQSKAIYPIETVKKGYLFI